MSSTEIIKLAPRESAPQGTRVTSWWLEGSRERYGAAYFVSETTLLRADGGQTTSAVIWRSNRPYGTNDRIGQIDRERWLLTWADVDAMVLGR
jgi:hypothetical protein